MIDHFGGGDFYFFLSSSILFLLIAAFFTHSVVDWATTGSPICLLSTSIFAFWYTKYMMVFNQVHSRSLHQQDTKSLSESTKVIYLHGEIIVRITCILVVCLLSRFFTQKSRVLLILIFRFKIKYERITKALESMIGREWPEKWAISLIKRYSVKFYNCNIGKTCIKCLDLNVFFLFAAMRHCWDCQ